MSQRNSGFARRPNEDYPTPFWVAAALAHRLRRRARRVWEPAAGDGGLAHSLEALGFETIATADDFLGYAAPPLERVDAIVTNPPYGDDRHCKVACAFIRHALALEIPLVAMLLKIDFDSARLASIFSATTPASPASWCSSTASSGSLARAAHPSITPGTSGTTNIAARRASPMRANQRPRGREGDMTAIDFSDADEHGRLAREPLNVEINALIERAATTDLPRGFLGASIVGHHCLRQIQFDWWCRPLLADRVRLIFDRGHFFEAEARRRLVTAGFMFTPPEALAFIALDGFLQGPPTGSSLPDRLCQRLFAASLRMGVQSSEREKLSCGRARRTRKDLSPLQVQVQLSSISSASWIQHC